MLKKWFLKSQKHGQIDQVRHRLKEVHHGQINAEKNGPSRVRKHEKVSVVTSEKACRKGPSNKDRLKKVPRNIDCGKRSLKVIINKPIDLIEKGPLEEIE